MARSNLGKYEARPTRRQVDLWALADIEASDQAVLDPKNMVDHLVRQHATLEIAHGLVDLDLGRPSRIGREVGRLHMRVLGKGTLAERLGLICGSGAEFQTEILLKIACQPIVWVSCAIPYWQRFSFKRRSASRVLNAPGGPRR